MTSRIGDAEDPGGPEDLDALVKDTDPVEVHLQQVGGKHLGVVVVAAADDADDFTAATRQLVNQLLRQRPHDVIVWASDATAAVAAAATEWKTDGVWEGPELEVVEGPDVDDDGAGVARSVGDAALLTSGSNLETNRR